MRLTHLFTPPNNRRIANLCGPLDENLRQIEDRLGVRIAHRHEQFKVEGPKAAATLAMEVLQTLYEQAARPIEPEHIHLTLTGSTLTAAATETDTTGTADTAPPANRRTAGTGKAQPRTSNQSIYADAILTHDIVFATGPAGTGKTYLAVAAAVAALDAGDVRRIILTRPAVEAGERLGFLPGDLTQKVDPYLRPLYDALYELMGFERVGRAFERQQLEIAPLAFMRGRTLNHAFVILDEAQNSTPEQMKMFLTRTGFASKVVVTGDTSQVDLPRGQTSGLVDATRVLRHTEGIAHCRFTSADVVRHPLVARIIDAYDAAAGKG